VLDEDEVLGVISVRDVLRAWSQRAAATAAPTTSSSTSTTAI